MRAPALAAYGILALPLSMVALPVYMQVPAWYVGQIGLALPVTGYVLFGARILDTGQDPFLGRLVDSLQRRGRLAAALWCAALLLALAFAGLWFPPTNGTTWMPAAWLALMLGLTYSAHSLLNIALLAWGARVAPDTRGRTVAAAWRESSGLVGVVLASVLPAWLVARPSWTPAGGMAVYALGFALVLGLALAALLGAAPPWDRGADQLRAPRRPAPPAVRRLWLPYVINALAVAIPGTLVLFYISDRLVRPDLAPAYLSTYFVAGAAGMPGWTWLSRRIGPARAWAVAMALAVCMFFWALFLGPGDALAFGAVCLMSGLALGADLVLPPVLLAAAIPPDQDPAAQYGIWTLLGKLATAVSALTLPLLAWLGYRPGASGGGGHALAIAYAAIPCGLKLIALSLLIALVIAKEEKTP